MSRSYLNTSISGIAVCRSEKPWKILEHQRWRVRLRTVLTREDYQSAEYDKLESCWNWGKDGKSWFGPPFTLHQNYYRIFSYQDHWDEYRKYLRK